MILCRWASCSSVVSRQLFLGDTCNVCHRRLVWRSLWWPWSGGHLLLQSSLSHRPGIHTTFLLLHSKSVSPAFPHHLLPPTPPLLSPWLVSPPWSPAGGPGLQFAFCLSIFTASDCFVGVITRVCHFGANPWLYPFPVSLELYAQPLWVSVSSSIK